MMTKTDAVLDATQALRKADFTVEQADTQVRAIGAMTDHLASKEDLTATKSDLKLEIANGTNKVILAMTGILIGVLGLFFVALQIWPPS